jgi:hypothetical protein
MPATSPRITFTPSPGTYELLARLSKATGAPLSACTRDMLDTLQDHLGMLVLVLEKARDLNDSARDAAHAAATEANLVMGPLLEEAARVMLKLATAIDEPGLPLQPPTSNTGVTNAGNRRAA